tara:strand:- start:613 stop:780 length:168 start_codon:yes stop_codon:yes gene_type:complete
MYVLIASGLSMLLSIFLFFFGTMENNELYGIYVGLWVPSIMIGFRMFELGNEDGS